MVQYDPDGSGHEVKFKPFSYPDMIHGYDKYKKPKASVDVGDVRTAEFAGRTTNLANGVNGETISYKGTIDDNGVINYAK
jgi:hypothetical protein